MKTRARPAKAKKSDATAEPSSTSQVVSRTLQSDENPPRLFILPKSISKDATIVTLAHSRTLRPTRYFCCPETGFYEFKSAATTPTQYRSCLLQSPIPESSPKPKDAETSHETKESEVIERDGSSLVGGYAMKTPEIFTATQIDPLFIILPSLSPTPSSKGEERKLFLQSDDLMEKLFDVSKHFREVLSHPKIRTLLEERMEAVSDIVEAGDEKMYRLSANKLLAEVVSKAKQVVAHGLPKSLESKFVVKPLEKPVLAVKNEVAQEQEKVTIEDTETQTSVTEASQSSTGTSASLESQASISTTFTVPDEPLEDTIPTDLLDLQRLQVALQFIITSYIPSHLANTLTDLLRTTESPVDFKALDDYLAEIAKMKAEAVSQRSVGDFTRKRGYEDDEVAADREAKKQKKEEEEKRKKAGESLAVKNLKKADITGMKKMSDFFKKAGPKK